MNAAFERARLRDVTERTHMWNPERHERDSIRYIDVSAVSREDLSIYEVSKHEASTAPSRARKVVRADDTIFATVRPGLKRIAQVPAMLDDSIASTAFCVLRPKLRSIDPDFLFFAVAADTFIRSVMARETGASYPAVRDGDILDQEIPLPPLDVQVRIAAVLRAVRTAIRKNLESLALSSRLKSAAMSELFTQGLRGEAQKETEIGLAPETWLLDQLGAHYSVGSGGTPARVVAGYWEGGTIPWVKTTEIDYRVINSTEECITPAGLQNSAARMYPPGTLLMAMYGQGITRGRVAILGIKAACNQACAAMNPLDEAIDSRFLFHFLAFRYDEIRRLAHGGQQQNLNMDIVRTLLVSYPTDVNEQRKIADVLDAIDKKIDLHERKRTVLGELFKGLLHNLMTGAIRVSDLDLSVLQAPNADVAPA